MIVTEKEARQKICWRSMEASRGFNFEAGTEDWPASRRCMASDCMAWRPCWRSKNDPDAVVVKSHPPSPDWERVGYCGLAGKP